MGALWKIFKEALDLPKGEQYDDSALMDISPPEFENWEETERKRKRLPLKYQPEDDDNLMFFEKGLHQDVNRPESERSGVRGAVLSLRVRWQGVRDCQRVASGSLGERRGRTAQGRSNSARLQCQALAAAECGRPRIPRVHGARSPA